MISGNGRYVVFQSKASNLVESDSNAAEDVFVRDLDLGVTTLVSVNSGGTDSGSGTTFKGASFSPWVSQDGRFVTFVSFATDLVSGVEVERVPNVFVRDRDPDGDGVFDEPGESLTTLLSIAKDGTAAGLSGAGPLGTGPEARPIISPDGAFVTFASGATDLATTQTVPGGGELMDENFGFDVIKASTDGTSLEYLSLNRDGTATPTNPFGVRSNNAFISSGSSRVVYESSGFDIVDTVPENPLEWNFNIFVTSGGRSELVSVNAAGDNGGDGPSKNPVISRDGRHVAFVSRATDLVEGVEDVNGALADIYVRDLVTKTTAVVSRSGVVPGTTGNGESPLSFAARKHFWGGPAVSGDGRFVAFVSHATDLLDPAGGIVDENVRPDAYVLDRDSDGDGIFDEPGETEMILVSVNDETGASGAGGIFGVSNPSISDNGRFVAFATDTAVLPGTVGMHVYVRDLLTSTTYLVSPGSGASGGPPVGGTLGDASVSISDFTSSVDRVAFTSLAGDLDPNVTDPGGVDVYAYTPSTDIRLGRSFATGGATHSQSVSVFFEDAAPIELGFYRSADRTFDASDELLGALVTGETAIGSTLLETEIGPEAGEVPFPSTSEADPLEDYFLLTVGDHLDVQPEFDGDPVNEDNTVASRGPYHLPIGPLFFHGGPFDDTVTVSVEDETIAFSSGGAGLGAVDAVAYGLADVTDVRIRSHEGNDAIIGSELAEIVFGGPGDDKINGGPGDDTLDGGPGNDGLIGGPGDDTIFDGPGDDSIDVGPGDDIVISTPGSDDIFIDGGGIDTLDFSFADQAISIDIDLDDVQTVDENANTIDLDGIWEDVVGSPFDDLFRLRPIPGGRTADGGTGTDTLSIDAGGLTFIDGGAKVSFPDSPFGDIEYTGFENIQIVNRTLFGDLDRDGRVAFNDFIKLTENFGKSNVTPQDGDVDGDGEITFEDFVILSSNFGKRIVE